MQREKPVYSFGPRKFSVFARMSPILATFGVPFGIVLSSGNPALAAAIGAGSAVLLSGKSFYKAMDLLTSKCSLYKDSMEYKTGWIRQSKRMVKYENIVDVSFSQDAAERLLRHGTILITTKGTTERKLELKLIHSPSEKYEMIKNIVNSSKNSTPKLP